jgi:putative transposase
VFTVLPYFVLCHRQMCPEVARNVLLATHGGLSLELGAVIENRALETPPFMGERKAHYLLSFWAKERNCPKMFDMKLTLQLQLLPTEVQRQALLQTMTAFNAAASYAARIGFDAKVYSQPSIHQRCYYQLRERFGLSAQMAVRAIAKAIEVFKRDKTRCPVFRPDGAITYDQRILSFKGLDKVSLWTLRGRELIPLVYGRYQAARFDRLKGQVDLVFRDGRFYLYATVGLPEEAPVDVQDFLGVDLGVANLATTSDGEHFSGAAVERTRQRYVHRRQRLGKAAGAKRRQGKRPKNIRRALRRARRREARFRRDVNHCISKRLVTHAKDSGRGIALEELTHIRTRTRFRKRQRAKMSSWAFSQLRQFVTYKAGRAGVPLRLIDPRNTSRTCSQCGHCEKANRRSQAEFSCQACGYFTHADLNGARNIRARALVNAPQGAGTAAPDTAA